MESQSRYDLCLHHPPHNRIERRDEVGHGQITTAHLGTIEETKSTLFPVGFPGIHIMLMLTSPGRVPLAL